MRARAITIAAVLLAAASAAAQYGEPRLSRVNPHASDPSGRLPDYDGGFRFCRVWFRNGMAGDGDGWYVDYPRADENLSIRLMELTKARVTQDGEGNPYPRTADPTNINHLWLLAKVGDHFMIWSAVSNVVLDAAGCRARPYLSREPDPRNINHLWSLRPVGNEFMIIPKVASGMTTNRYWTHGTLREPFGLDPECMIEPRAVVLPRDR